MLQNNPDFTTTKGTIKASMANFNGQANVKMYTDEEKNSLQHTREADELQKQIYDLPNRKILFSDFSNSNSLARGEE